MYLGARSGERSVGLIEIDSCARWPLGGVVPASLQNQTSICCLRLCKSPRRRLSLCFLLVPKQCKESLGSLLRRPGDLLQDLAACAPIISMFCFPLSENVVTLPRLA